MSAAATRPDTIVLIHGFWVTPAKLGALDRPLRGQGYQVLAPAYPGFEVEVEALNADPSPIEALTVPAIVEHLEASIGDARRAADPDRPLGRRRLRPAPARPRLRRRRRGDQLGPDRGRAASCRCRRSRRPSRCSRTRPTATARSASRSSSGTTRSRTPSARRSRARCTSATTSPRPGAIFWGSALANVQPGHQDTWVDYENDDRAPLLFISGSEDHLMPPSIQRSNAKHYKSTRSPRSRSTRATRTCCPPRTAGRRSPTTRSTWALEHAVDGATPGLEPAVPSA